MLNFSGFTRYPKKSKTSNRCKELETNFLQDADKVLDIFYNDDKQRKQCKIQYCLRMTSDDHAFVKIKKQNARVNVLQQSWMESIRTLKNFSTIQLFTGTIRLGSFFSKHAVLELTKLMPASTVYTVSTMQ